MSENIKTLLRVFVGIFGITAFIIGMAILFPFPANEPELCNCFCNCEEPVEIDLKELFHSTIKFPPPTQSELAIPETCSVVADRNIRSIREEGYMATKAIVGNKEGRSHALTGVLLLFDIDGEMLTPEEFNAYYEFRYLALVDNSLLGYEGIAPNEWHYEDFSCRCWRDAE